MVIRIMLVVLIVFPIVKGAIPGTFFWKPRLSLDLSIPTTENTQTVNLPTHENIEEGLVVLIEGYEIGMTVVGLASGLSSSATFPQLNPLSGYFYTNAYRWGLRHLSLLPQWLGGTGGHYCETLRVWKRRFFYMDEFPPDWFKKMLPFVNKDDWKKEELEFKKFKKYSESAFGKHYRYPSKRFNDFKSFESRESEEDTSSVSLSSGANE